MKSIIVSLLFLACVFAVSQAVTDQCQIWFRNTCNYYSQATRATIQDVMQDSLNHFRGECGNDQY